MEIIGWIAACLTTVSFLPQAAKTIKTKDVSGISLAMYVIFTSGVLFWTIYGISLGNLTIIVANLVTLVLSGTILYIKISDIRKKLKSVQTDDNDDNSSLI